MTRLRWAAWIALTCSCCLLTWAGLPARRQLVPATGLSRSLRLVVLVNAPVRLVAQLNETALVDGLFDFDDVRARAELSVAAREADLPPLEPPVQLPPTQRRRLQLALDWIRPERLALVQVERGGAVETWLGVQGGRSRLAGRVAAWFVENLTVADNLWVRLGRAAPKTPMPAAAQAWDWPRAADADLLAVLPGGIAAATPVSAAAPPSTRQQKIAALCGALGLPTDCTRAEAAVWVAGGQVRWQGQYQGAPPRRPVELGPQPVLPAQPQLPPAFAPGVFLTLHLDLDWAWAYHGWQAAMSETERADFQRSMRWYRMAENGYDDPESQFLAPLGRGCAIAGRRGPVYNGAEWMPSLQAELPLKPEPQGLLDLLRDSPNRRFRQMMPDFAEARFDKIRRVGQSRYSVHPSYVAITTGVEQDRYVLIRPSIAGSALMPAWQVNLARVKFGTRPDVLEMRDLLADTPAAGTGASAESSPPPPAVKLYFDPAAVTDQLDNFRILVKVEAGADRPKPDDGLTLERIAAENARIVELTEKNMRIAARVGWVLQRLGPLHLEISPMRTLDATATGLPADGGSAVFQGSIDLKSR